MRDADVSAAVSMWREHGATDLPWEEIEQALRRLPDAGICAVSDDGVALLMLTPADVVFTVSADGGRVTLRSRPLDARRLTVQLQWAGDRSEWKFRYSDEPDAGEPWQDITGSVSVDGENGHERPDDREQFARALAECAGWAHGTRDQSQGETSSAAMAEGAEVVEPRWRASTDVWGRPLDVRRR